MSRSWAMVVVMAIVVVADVVAGLLLAIAVQVLAVPVAGLQASARSLRLGGVFTRLSLLRGLPPGRLVEGGTGGRSVSGAFRIGTGAGSPSTTAAKLRTGYPLPGDGESPGETGHSPGRRPDRRGGLRTNSGATRAATRHRPNR